MKRLLSLVMLLTFANTLVNAESLTFGVIAHSPDQQVGAKVLTEIYKRLGISVNFAQLPGRRSLIMSSGGNLDGETQRIEKIGDMYPNLIRVPTSYINWNIAIFAKHKTLDEISWTALQGQNVAVVRGVQFAKDGLESAGVVNVKMLNDLKQVMRYLNAERTDFAISSEFNGKVNIAKLGFRTISPLTPSLLNIKNYHYLHIKHQHLIYSVNDVIKKMQQSGELKRLKTRFMKEVFAEHKNSSGSKQY